MPSRARPSQPDRLAAAVSAVSRHLTVPGTDLPLVPYAEQLAAARALLSGAVVEMATGDGKTVVAALAAAVLATSGPVHIATANGYLAARDADLLRPVYVELGLSTGVVTPATPPTARRTAYSCDVVYATLSELGFDYLRDRLVTRPAGRVQARGLDALVVDEADLLLIDEARTPLMIARPRTEADQVDWLGLAALVRPLLADQHERVRAKLAILQGGTEDRFTHDVITSQVRRGLPRDPEVVAYFARTPGAAQTAARVEHELRGGPAWMLDDGLLATFDERSRLASLTVEGQQRVEAVLGPVFADPKTHGLTLAALQSLLLAYGLYERDRDYVVQDGAVVLIEEATGRAAAGRRFLHGLHSALEVKELSTPNIDSETLAQISVQQFVRQYRRRAGMTGTAKRAATEFQQIYGMPLRVIPRHRPNRRRDLLPRLFTTKALVNEAIVEETAAAYAQGQPVLIGAADIERSEAIAALLRSRAIDHQLLHARNHAHEAEVVAGAGRAGAVTVATALAGRGTDIRLHGPHGLLVLIAEPGASSRIDDQLRGRAGRQGDPGASRLFASLEDETLRLYGDERVRAGAARALRTAPFLEGARAGRVIRDAQERAERLHEGQRRRLFEFDQVLEAQRQAMLRTFERVLNEPEPERLLADIVRSVAAGETAPAPVVMGRYGLGAPPSGSPTQTSLSAEDLRILLSSRLAKVEAEHRTLYAAAGGDDDGEGGEAHWRELVRAVLLQTATRLWARHVEDIDELQRESPATYGFLPGPIAVPFAREASRRFEDYVWSVGADTLATLFNIPLPYEVIPLSGTEAAITPPLRETLEAMDVAVHG